GQQVQAMAAEDPSALRQALQTAEAERSGAEEEITRVEDEARRVQSVYREATERARTVQGAHAEAVRAWREEATQAERLRSAHEAEDRARYALERRAAGGDRVLRGRPRGEPAAAVAG